MKPSLTVRFAEDRTYPIYIGTGILQASTCLAEHIAGSQAALLSNKTVAYLYGGRVRAQLPPNHLVIEIGDGEEFKSLATYSDAMDGLLQAKHNRSTTIVALGGGVVGDLAGFVAATYQRGVAYIQIPTTLLAQVDSAVGGKTAVNHRAGKNMIGAFYQPSAVIIDVETLATLPQRVFVEGLAEVIKYGVIHDPEFFAWLEKNRLQVLDRDAQALHRLIQRCCQIKATIVEQDERETGLRATLNFGHTFGHAIETLTDYGTYLHGEAVALGMVLAADLSARMQICDRTEASRVKALLSAYGLNVEPPALDIDQWIASMSMDKKVQNGKLRFVLMNQLGSVRVTSDVDADLLETTLTAGPALCT